MVGHTSGFFRAPALPPVGRWEKGAPVLPEERARTKPSAPFSGHCVRACHKTLKLFERDLPALRWPSFPFMLSAVEPTALPAPADFIAGSSPDVGARHRAGPAERYCSQSRSCARCATSSASGRTYAAYSVGLLHRRPPPWACCTDAGVIFLLLNPVLQPRLGLRPRPVRQLDFRLAL